MKKNLLFALIITLTSCLMSYGQAFDWGFSSGSDLADEGKKLVSDSEGNVFVAGFFQDTMDVFPGSVKHNLISKGGKDMFIAKYSSTGIHRWAYSFGSTGIDFIADMATDAYGNIYVTGTFYGTVDFDPSAGQYLVTSNGDRDIFWAKYSNDGAFQWVKKLGGTSYDEGKQIAIKGNDLYVTGYFRATVDFNPSAVVENITADGTDMFITKYSINGTYRWTKTINIGNSDYISDSEIDDDNNIYVAGYFQDTIDFNPGTDVSNVISIGGYDGFLLKLNGTDGGFGWARRFGNAGFDFAESIVIKNNYVYLAGVYNESLAFIVGSSGGIFKILSCTSNGGQDGVILKYTTDGGLSKLYSAGGLHGDGFFDMTKDNDGNFYLLGKFGPDKTDFDFSTEGEFKLGCNNSSTQDVFVASYDSSMNFRWVKGFGSSTFDHPRSLCVADNNNVYLTVSSTGQLDMDPDEDVELTEANGFSDVILVKLRPYLTGTEIKTFTALETNSIVIDSANTEIKMYLQDEMDLSNILVSYTLSEGAKLLESLTSDFTDSVFVTVAAEDTSIKKEWTIIATHISDTLANITRLSFEGHSCNTTINVAEQTVNIEMLEACDISSLIANIEVSDGAVITPLSGTAQNFTDTVSYTVVSKDLSNSNVWNVIVEEFVTSVSNNDLQNEILVYPNPASNKVSIQCEDDDTSYDFINLTGQTVKSGILERGINSIDVTSLKRGIYFVKLDNQDNDKIFKLIIE